MAMKIDPETCIDCAACVEPCPNAAIFPGGEAWPFNGRNHAPLSDKFFIAPEKCTECRTYYDAPQCVEACPMDCIANDPERVEAAGDLEDKANRLRAERKR